MQVMGFFHDLFFSFWIKILLPYYKINSLSNLSETEKYNSLSFQKELLEKKPKNPEVYNFIKKEKNIFNQSFHAMQIISFSFPHQIHLIKKEKDHFL